MPEKERKPKPKKRHHNKQGKKREIGEGGGSSEPFFLGRRTLTDSIEQWQVKKTPKKSLLREREWDQGGRKKKSLFSKAHGRGENGGAGANEQGFQIF